MTASRTTSDTPRSTLGRSRLKRLVLGAETDPGWARPALWGLLAATALLYLWDLSNSGNANSFYAAAVKSGTEDWRAWLFGSLDSGNAITVDKPPASLWLMVLSCRMLGGYSSFAMLLPQALLGIGTVALVHASVTRWFGPATGLLAGALVAVTPVAALMFRFNNPDAALVFAMTLAAYCVIRAIDAPAERKRAALGWLVAAGAAIGFAFLTKMMQGLLVLPGLAFAYLAAGAAPSAWTRIKHLIAAFVAVVVSAGWFVALVSLWPAASRAYIGGSTNNSLWELALGYNGLGRITGGEGNGGGGGGTGFGGSAGIFRMFNTAFGTEISWFLPAAVVAFLAAVVLTTYADRFSRLRTAAILWGGWLGVTMIVFSLMSGTIHPYYSVALVPALAAMVAIGGRALWDRRDNHYARVALATMIGITGLWGAYLLHRDASGWQNWLVVTMIIGSLGGAIALGFATGGLKQIAVAAVLVGVLSATLGSTAFTVATAANGHTGSTPASGPGSVSAGGFGGMQGGGSMQGGPGGQSSADGQTGAQSTSTTSITDLLNRTTTRWSAATIGSQSAAEYILSTDTAVMAIGGFSGSDNSPTLAQFKQYVADGDITYFISGGGMGGGMGGGTGSASAITSWVEANFTATTVNGVTIYDLTSK